MDCLTISGIHKWRQKGCAHFFHPSRCGITFYPLKAKVQKANKRQSNPYHCHGNEGRRSIMMNWNKFTYDCWQYKYKAHYCFFWPTYVRTYMYIMLVKCEYIPASKSIAILQCHVAHHRGCRVKWPAEKGFLTNLDATAVIAPHYTCTISYVCMYI